MPAIILFGRGWQFSSDDFVYSSLFIIFLRTILMLLVAIPLILFCDSNKECLPEILFILIYTGISIDVAQILVRCALAFASSRGGIADVYIRNPVTKIFYLNVFLMLLELPIYSSILYYESTSKECISKVCLFIKIDSILAIILIPFNLFLFLLTYDSTGRVWKDTPGLWCGELDIENSQLNHFQAYNLNARLWNRRIRCLSCLTNVGRHHDKDIRQTEADTLQLVSDIVGHYFMTNLVYSDLLSGLILLRWQTRQWVGCGHRIPLSRVLEDSEPFEPAAGGSLSADAHMNMSQLEVENTPISRLEKEWLSIRRICAYFRFAEAIYGHLLYLFAHKLSIKASCTLCKQMRCCSPCCQRRRSPASTTENETDPMLQVSDDFEMGCCVCDQNNCYLAVFKEVTKVPLDNLIHYSFVNKKVCLSPFLVTIDDETESIVIAIRGTLSPQDMIVDMLAEGKYILASEAPPDCEELAANGHLFVHMGMLITARKMRDSIMDMRLIEKARDRQRRNNLPDYPLVVVGHSLGAGVASILAFLFKRHYPEVKAYAYSPPLGLMNARLARYCKPFICSIIYGFDIVPRLSIPTLNDLKWRLLDALVNCKVPKYRVMGRGARMIGMRFFLPKCCRPPIAIGMDSRLLNLTLQHHLLYPVVHMSRRISSSSSIDYSTTSPTIDKNTIDNFESANLKSSTHAKQPHLQPTSDEIVNMGTGRFLPGNRSLMCWLRKNGSPVLKTGAVGTKFGTFYTTPSRSADQRTGEFSTSATSVTEQSSASMPDGGKAPLDDLVSMDTNVRFAGVAFHVVEVMDDVNVNHGDSSQSEQPPVGIWSHSRQFQSILIHSRMMRDHLPDVLGDALSRLLAASTSTTSSTARLRKLKRPSL